MKIRKIAKQYYVEGLSPLNFKEILNRVRNERALEKAEKENEDNK